MGLGMGRNRAGGTDSLSPCMEGAPAQPRSPDWLAAVLAAFVALPAVVAPYGADNGYTPDLHMSAYLQVLGCLVAAAFCMQRARARQPTLVFDGLWVILFLFVAWAFVSLSWAHNLYEACVKLFDWLAALLGAFLAVQIVRTPRHLRFLLQAVFWAGVSLALLGVAEFLFGVRWTFRGNAPAATFVNKNVAAQYFLLIFPLGAWLCWQSRRRTLQWVYALATALVVTVIVYSKARAAWLALLVAGAIIAGFCLLELLKSPRPLRNAGKTAKALAVAVSIVLVLVAVHFNRNGFTWFFSDVAELGARTVQETRFDGTGIHRINIWANTLAMIADRPVSGVGLGNWMVEYPRYHARVLVDRQTNYETSHINAHNDYLEIAAELGLIGFGLVLWLAAAIVRKVVGGLASEAIGVRVFLFAAVAGIAVAAAFSFPFQQPVTVFLSFIYIALLSSWCAGERGPAPGWLWAGFRLRVPRNALWWWAAAFFVVACGVVLIAHVQLYRSELHFREAMFERSRDHHAPMAVAGQRAHDLNPYRDRLLRFVALGQRERGEYEQAAATFERVLTSYPYLVHALHHGAVSHLRAGEPGKALEKLERLAAMRTHDHELAVGIAMLLSQLDRDEEAAAYLRRAIAAAPEGEDREAVQALYERQTRRR